METKNIKYPYLPEGRTILYVSENNPYMLEAKKTCIEQATDWIHPSGAVVLQNEKIIGRGALQSRLNNRRLIKFHHEGWCIRKFFKIPSGEKYWLCPGCVEVYNHSEQMAIKNAFQNNEDTKGADMYFWGHWWCCESCWNQIIKAGIKNIFLMEKSEIFFNKTNPNHIVGKIFDNI